MMPHFARRAPLLSLGFRNPNTMFKGIPMYNQLTKETMSPWRWEAGWPENYIAYTYNQYKEDKKRLPWYLNTNSRARVDKPIRIHEDALMAPLHLRMRDVEIGNPKVEVINRWGWFAWIRWDMDKECIDMKELEEFLGEFSY